MIFIDKMLTLQFIKKESTILG